MMRGLADEVRRRATLFQRVMVASQVMLVAVVLMVLNTMGEPMLESPKEAGILFLLLAIGAVFDLSLAWLLPKFLLRDEGLRRVMRDADPHAPLEPPPGAARDVGLHPLRAGLQAALGPYLIRLALIESVAIYGVVFSILTVDPRYCIGFGLVALAATLSARFDASRVEEIYRRLELENAWQRDV